MAIPPRPKPSDYEAALRRIHRRRRAAGDDHPLALSEDPREVLSYLRRLGHAGLVRDESGDDVTDALILRLWLWWEGEATEMWLLDAAERRGLNRREVGALLGLSSGQGLVDRIERKRTMLGRPARPAAQTAPPVADVVRDARLRELVVALVARRAEMPEEIADSMEAGALVDALAIWPPGAPPPTTSLASALRLLLDDLVAELPDGAPLRDVAAHGFELVGARSRPPSPEQGQGSGLSELSVTSQ